ncbi:hypothetical protein CRG98_013416 [Punica granatum]|uniref:Retrovirus-related Pol polyprotein from transposon TNT 1-94-like beta-barrel domain-containing protein n=1 Tax=Punica granatum TaxID=22663 RepID=A0A2I0KDD7_PUNGR|nr:hypothetical protein CRG98_013416 [Punica granatum]
MDGQRNSGGWDSQYKAGSSKGSRVSYGKKQHSSYGKKSTVNFSQPNAVQAVNQQTANQSFSTLPFSEGQIQRLLSLIGPDEEGENKIDNRFDFVSCNETWIIDIGASKHMTCCSRFLFNPSSLRGDSTVLIPNEKSVQATHAGSVHLGGNFTLSNVLLVPEFNCNLISVAGPSEEMNCHIIFSSDLCLIQDRVSKKMIGVGIGGQQDGTPLFIQDPVLHEEEQEKLGWVNGEAHNSVHGVGMEKSSESPIRPDDGPMDHIFPGRASPSKTSPGCASFRIRSDGPSMGSDPRSPITPAYVQNSPVRNSCSLGFTEEPDLSPTTPLEPTPEDISSL